ncbi:transferrin-binding protein-like solute binding protein [Photobacterium sp. GJ3]|uniref:Slam-dependent surface lipoprotein n=1 Tax=Photobacterium sp. GJ3 TaxID=2829502 RepID=UPI001B8A9AFF|nr:Slam-dependent surface lipoprotein [Photobacterium sp. GJ3]QUJ67824.1 transferrin-binding protein-like solute binding protein [Photobacterium sp. GJ3]
MKKAFITLAVFSACVSGAAQANFVGNQSDNTQIQVGESTMNAGPHVAGRAGIGAASMGSTAQKVDFQALKNYGSVQNGVYVLGGGHSGMGKFNFAKVGAGDVWFGEWASDISSDTDRTVYYVGDTTGTTLPTSGTATYAVKGVNKFSGSNDLNGTFTANFSNNTLNGSIANSQYTLGVNATINSATAAFNGTASVGPINGTATGHFFGNNAAALAGIAQFSSNFKYFDTAFGGTKQ